MKPYEITESFARYIKTLDTGIGEQRLWHLTPPLPDGTEYAVTSSVVVPYTGRELLVFRANAEGDITDWLEVGGGRGEFDHVEVLKNMGYENVGS